jgi:hypothetical protein
MPAFQVLLWLTAVVSVSVLAHVRGRTGVRRHTLSDAPVPSVSSPPPPYVEQSNTVLMAQHSGREVLLGQFGLGSAHVPTSSGQLTALSYEQEPWSPPRQGHDQITATPDQGKQRATNTPSQA